MQGTVTIDTNHRERVLEILKNSKNSITADEIRLLIQKPEERQWITARVMQVVRELRRYCGYTIRQRKAGKAMHYTFIGAFADEYEFTKRYTDKFLHASTKKTIGYSKPYQTRESAVTLTEQAIPEELTEEKEEALFHSFLKSIPDPDPEVTVEMITTPVPEIISEPVIEIIPEPVVIPEPIKEKKLHLICSSEIAACVRPCYHYIKSHIDSSTTIAEIMDYYSLTEEQSIVLLNTVGRKYASEIKIKIEAKAV